MAKKRGEQTDAAVDTLVESNPASSDVPNGDTPAADVPNGVDGAGADDTDPEGAVDPEAISGRIILDSLDPACKSKELRARYTDEQKSKLRDLFDAGKIVREVRAIKISGKKNPTGVHQYQPYYAYRPVFNFTLDDNGGMIVDMTAAYYLAGEKMEFHGDWTAEKREAKTDAEIAQKLIDEKWGAESYFDHGLDLKIRADVRPYLSDELMGPIADIAKQVKSVFLLDIEPTKQAAFDNIIASRIRRGQPVPDGLTLEGLNIKWPQGK